jgi:GNAT superfamily N-acetyltransferase
MPSLEEYLAIYDREQRINLRLPEFTYEMTGRILWDHAPQDATGYVDYAGLDESCADTEIDALLATFRSRGLSAMLWKVFDHDRPADLRQRLAARGFTIESPDALMLLDLQNSPVFAQEPEPTPTLQKVTSLAEIEEIVSLEEIVWQGPRAWLRKWLSHLLVDTPERLSPYVIRLEGQVVAAAWTLYYPPSSFARLLGGSTLPEYRQRGLYTRLLAARAYEARRRGCRFLTVDASPMSQPILEKNGFQTLGYSTQCRWKD